MSILSYDPETRMIINNYGNEVAEVHSPFHDRDPSLGHTMAAARDLLDAAKQLDRLSLLIKHAVSYSAASPDYDAVVTAIKDLRAGIKKATTP